jgi:hypothetical protein
MRITFLAIFFLVTVVGLSQNKTIAEKQPVRETAAAHRVMIVPFEPRLYMSEIDHRFNEETKLSFNQIRARFRDGLNEQLYKSFKNAQYNVVDLMDDTVKYKKDLEKVYQHISYAYMKVPDQENYKPPVKDKDEKKISKGQLTVETDGERRFMNSRIRDTDLLPKLHIKHKTDVFVLINQLDIKSVNQQDVLSQGSGKRKITLHYTVLTYTGKEINSGIVEEEFDTEVNNPNKVIGKYISRISSTVVKRVNKALGLTGA